jgi:hypothetical protein
MVAPLALMIVVAIVFLVLMEVVALVRRVSHPVDEWCRRAGDRIARLVRRTGFTPSSAIACALLAFAIAFDAWILFWRFPDLVTAMLWSIEDATPEMLSRLAPSNFDEQSAYRQTLALGVLLMGFGLFKAVQIASRRGERVRSILIAAVVAATSFNLVLMDFPYRILWWNEGKPVTYKGARCYVLASKMDSVRLFCSSGTPRKLELRWGDLGTQTPGEDESIFEPFSRPASK